MVYFIGAGGPYQRDEQHGEVESGHDEGDRTPGRVLGSLILYRVCGGIAPIPNLSVDLTGN